MQGALDQAIIRRYLKRNLQKLQRCYDDSLTDSPGLAGTATVKFTIAVHGTVTDSTARGMASTELHACMIGSLQAIRGRRAGARGHAARHDAGEHTRAAPPRVTQKRFDHGVAAPSPRYQTKRSMD